MRIKHFLLIGIVVCFPFMLSANPIKDLLERIEPGASGRFIVQLEKTREKISLNSTKRETKWLYAEILTSILLRD